MVSREIRPKSPTRFHEEADFEKLAKAKCPARERSGEVEARILDAARQVFLERGLAGASVDEIAVWPEVASRRSASGRATVVLVMRLIAGDEVRMKAPGVDEVPSRNAFGLSIRAA